MDNMIFIVLAWHSDGSTKGPETVLAVFKTRALAERFLELVQATCPSKELGIAPMSIEP